MGRQWDDGRPRPAVAFGERVRTARAAVGLSQRAVARAIRVTQPAYWQYEQGICAPSGERLARLAAVLQLDPGELSALVECGRREAEE